MQPTEQITQPMPQHVPHQVQQPMPSYQQPPRQHQQLGLEKSVVAQKVQQLLILIYTAVSILLTGRFILSLIGTNISTPFVSFVYQVTFPFVAPFANMFGTTLQAGVHRIEFESLVALLVYALVFFGIAKLISIIFD